MADNVTHGAQSGAPKAHEEHHPTWQLYVKVGIILAIITAIEVSAFYIPAWEGSRIYVPSMLFLSTLKFVAVVMFYMHLKYDHPLFTGIFLFPMALATLVISALFVLYHFLNPMR